MCGIAALYAWHSDAPPVSREEVDRITDSMTPRGPDARGTWFSADGRVALGSRRLAIIDPKPEGDQPFVSRELSIVFNGEIYNYQELRATLERGGVRFRTTTDTEVILELYRRDGAACVEALRGMFAFAIFDTDTRKLFVARDPYGIKPLYVADDGRTLRIASQVKALMAGGAISRTRDVAAEAGFFLLGSVPEPLTIREAIRAVEAGTSFFVSPRGIEAPRRNASIAAVFAHATEQRAIARLMTPETMLRERVAESVGYHLVSDVPVGAFLSAGIDSTAIATLASEQMRGPLRTFTLAFEQGGDESDDASRFARELGAEHSNRMVTRSEFREDLPRIFEAMDQPTIDGVNTWFVSKAVHEAGIKVALSGVGGDELFGSYPSFAELPRMVRTTRIATRLPLGRRAMQAGTSLMTLLGAHPKVRAVPRFGGTWAGAYLLKRGLYLPQELPSLLGHEAAEEGLRRLAIETRIAGAIEPDPQTAYGRVATLEAAMYMRNQLLRDTDWASMAHSVEVRTPLVDASLLRQLAPLLLARGSECKQGLAAVLPRWLREQPKRGFFVPLAEWADLAPDGTTKRMRSWARVVLESAG
jgi:asparagine synthase (glutamine-hydrolysing)